MFTEDNGGSSNTSAEIAVTEQGAVSGGFSAETNADIEKGNVSADFLKDIQALKGNTVVETEKVIEQPKEAEKVQETVTEKVVEQNKEGESAEKKEGEEDVTDLKTPEGESIKATRIAEVKNWGKGWQETAEAREPAYKFVQEKFNGNMEEAEIAANLFDNILGTDVNTFNPVEVFNELAELSKPRAEKLIEFFATNESVLKMAEDRVIEKVFGKDLTAEELQEDLEGYKLFKQVGGLSAVLGEDGELPAQLQFDAEGNPRPEEEVDVLKTFLKEVKGIKSERQQEAARKAEETRIAQETAINNTIDSYTEERFGQVKETIKKLGLEVNPNDTDEVKAAKTRDSRMINFYVLGMASEDENFKTAYKSAVDAIKSQDSITANRKKIELNKLIADYTSEIMDDYIAKNNIKIETKEKQITDATKDTKKEIDLAGGDVNAIAKSNPNESVEQRVARLVKEGKLRSA